MLNKENLLKKKDIHSCTSSKVNKQKKHQGMVLLNDGTSILRYINIIINSLKVIVVWILGMWLIILKTKQRSVYFSDSVL